MAELLFNKMQTDFQSKAYVFHCMCVCVCVWGLCESVCRQVCLFLKCIATSAKVLRSKNQSYHHGDCYVMCKFKVHYSSSSIVQVLEVEFVIGMMAPSSGTTQATIMITIRYLDSRIYEVK